MFIDRVVVRVEAGTGGSGASSFRREKFVPMGGPDGGDGGRGGDVIVRADRNLGTLLDYTYRDSWKAERGDHGSGSNKSGRSGADVVMPVPPGTVIRDAESNELLGEVVEHGQEIIVAKGGRGGRGNAKFATATHQAPREWEPGDEGEVRQLELELKLIADVGLVGQPNAGKSTLLSVVSAARPKIADYPFTTLEPNLGVVQLDNYRTYVVADIPGLIEGAHTGAGLGIQFLRHIERTRLLAHLVDVSEASGRDPVHDFEIVMSELSSFSDDLPHKPMIVVATKLDSAQDPERVAALRRIAGERDLPFFEISSATGQGIDALKFAMADRVLASPTV
jgi:GTP-binding protein